MIVHRIPTWRTALIAWAASVRHLPYRWGETDCASLVRSALCIQYGRDLLPTVRLWVSARDAVAVLRAHAVPDLLRALGAEQLAPRRVAAWPLGTVLLDATRPRHPELSVVVPPVVVQSTRALGVCWTDPRAVRADVQAWRLTTAVLP